MCNILNTFVAINWNGEKNCVCIDEKIDKIHCYLSASMISFEHKNIGINIRHVSYTA